ncbi:thiamine phosphate synthase [Aliihoeflea aestuarii]|jgi:thiamine-phosphate pyrophosphorylase|uniref:thiamine phosphate synthase n=1 Tax=Aliihoeflea aestuarii TaxID=453840 RepID=UPI002093CE44|nr:thiamine phosphate synthase [Aliihoeflea aestuarii]MCO6391311.1 thiamine phosphate synthase [Aliihoeflea aestuarii]
MSESVPNRCRLVLIAPSGSDDAAPVDMALAGGDVASIILPRGERSDEAYQSFVDKVTPLAQGRGVAVIVEGDARVAMRAKADGLHFEGSKADLADMVERHGGKIMVGTGGVKTRDDALELGETQPDYMFFGRFGYDGKPDAHPRNLSLGEWWGEMVAVPCIVMAGSSDESVLAVAETGVDFVAVEKAVFAEGDAGNRVAALNALLDEKAPRFED